MCKGVVTTTQLCSYLYLNNRGEQVGLAAEYRRTICDLRNDGYKIEAQPVARGRWQYRLLPSQVEMFKQEAA